jgi:hypothetical protein
MHLVDPPLAGTFTTQELARLEAYRAAVAAGFYTDWDGSAIDTDARLLTRLLRTRRGATAAFTPQEREQLVRLRKAVAAGGYAGDRLEPAEPERTTGATDGGPQPLPD